MIKKNWVYLLFAFSVILFVVTRFTQNNHKGMVQLSSKMIHSDSLGWGYEIYAGKKLIIHQTMIPLVGGKKGFVSEEQAQTIADLLIKKMASVKGLPPLSIQELDSCGITR
jgi:hypothetical protein